MILGPSANNICVVNRRWNGYRTGGSGVNMTKGKRELLHGVGGEIVLVQKDIVMRRAGRSEQSCMGLEIEIKFGRRYDVSVHDSTGRAISATISISRLREEAYMMTLADNDERDLWHYGELHGSTCTCRE